MNSHFKKNIYLLVGLMIMLWSGHIYAQPDKARKDSPGNTIQLTRDTAVNDLVTWYSVFNPDETSSVNQNLEDTLINFYNPAKTQFQEKATLGNLGSPHYDLFYQSYQKIGLQIQRSPYSAYDFDIEKFKFYNIEAGYTDAAYSQSGQSNSMVDLLFTRNFNKDKTNFVLKYRRINQTGYYSNQNVKHTYLSTGINFNSLDDRLNTSFLFASNLANHNNNGGITDDEILTGINSTPRENIDIQLSQSSNRNHNLQYAMINKWAFFKKRTKKKKKTEQSNSRNKTKRPERHRADDGGVTPPDNLQSADPALFDADSNREPQSIDLDTSAINSLINEKPVQPMESTIIDSIQHQIDSLNSTLPNKKGLFSNRDLILFHALRYDNYAYEHKHESPTEAYHGNYFLNTDSLDFNLNGIRLSNELGLQLSLGRDNPLNISSSIEYIRHALEAQEYSDRLIDLILHNTVTFKIKDKYLFDGKLDLGLGDNSGELLAKGIISAHINKYINGSTSLTLLTQKPQYTQSNIILNDSLVQFNDLNNQKSIIWQTRINIPKYKITVGYNSVVLQDYIYADTSRQFQQATNTINLQQFIISSTLKWKFLNFKTKATFQLISDKDILRRPPIMLQETFYISGSLFKKQMKYKTGIHVNLIGNYRFMSYYPTLGIFHQSANDEVRHTLQYYPDATFFFEFKVNKFKMFVLAENLSAYFNNYVEFEFKNYPQFDNRVRLGIRWIFRK